MNVWGGRIEKWKSAGVLRVGKEEKREEGEKGG